jgi:hypothetical protein
MKVSQIPLALAVFLLLSFTLGAQTAFPRMTSIEPPTAKVGAEVTIAGENLDKGNVAEVYITDGDKDVKVQVTQQAATSMKIKIPETLKPGRFSLAVLTSTKPARLIDQPVRLTIE